MKEILQLRCPVCGRLQMKMNVQSGAVILSDASLFPMRTEKGFTWNCSKCKNQLDLEGINLKKRELMALGN